MGGTGDRFVLAAHNTLGAIISGFGLSDQIDLVGIAYGSATTASNSAGALTVGNAITSQTLTLAGSYTTSNFVLSNDGQGGTLVVWNA